MSYLTLRDASVLGYFGESPVFDPACPSCPPAGTTAAECSRIVRGAIAAAIRLANNAASKLEAKPIDSETVRLFRFFFGHDPTRRLSYASNRESGANVAHRFRKVAEALQRRGIRYQCGCPGADVDVRAQTLLGGNRIELCNRFWDLPAGLRVAPVFFRAGVLIHEVLHMLYSDFLIHTGRRANAHCYEAFAMRVAGHAADPSDVRQCKTPP
jgi:hypothetical protein